MIRYRLKKDLPDCKAGTILTKEDKPDGLYMYCGVLDGTDADSWYIKEVVENNPDWFELIKEEPKEWEIVERINNWKTMKEEIHSVKRISDNEVFTVGDFVVWNGFNQGIITSFEISPRNNKMIAKMDFGGICINNITKASKTDTKEVFTWDEKRVLEFGNLCHHDGWHQFHGKEYISTIMADYKESKASRFFTKEAIVNYVNEQSKPDTSKERIEVTDVIAAGCSDNGNWYRFHIARSPGRAWPEIPKVNFPLIKRAIEAVLNNDIVGLGRRDGHEIWTDGYNNRLFTQQQMDKAIEQTWEAARNYKSETPWFNDRPVYPTLESYLQTIKK